MTPAAIAVILALYFGSTAIVHDIAPIHKGRVFVYAEAQAKHYLVILDEGQVVGIEGVPAPGTSCQPE